MTKYGILKVGKKPLKISTYFNDDSLNAVVPVINSERYH